MESSQPAAVGASGEGASGQLLNRLSAEISAYRQRQISTFRETAIVLALITWGVSKLGFSEGALEVARYAAASCCLFIALVGFVIIMIYKRRIYYCRDRRAEVAANLVQSIADLNLKFPVFYPTQKGYFSDPEAPAKYRTWPSSGWYGAALLVFGVLAFIVNMVAARSSAPAT